MAKIAEKAEQFGPLTLAGAVVLMVVESRFTAAVDPNIAVLTEQITRVIESVGKIEGAVSRMEDQTQDIKIRQAVFDQLMQTRVSEINELRKRIETLEGHP